MSRRIEDLHPDVQEHVKAWLNACEYAGLDILITNTLRTIAEQNALYAKGRTEPGNRVTNAKGGYSFHNYGLAIDFCPMVNGICAWTRIDLFDKAGRLAKKFGFEWGGDWENFKDRPHIQMRFGLHIKDLRNGAIHNGHWAEKHFQSLNKKGITVSERRFDEPVTRGEMMAMIDRLTEVKK